MSPEKRNLSIVAPSAYLLGGVQSWLDYLVPGLESLGWDVSVLLVHGAASDAQKYLSVHPFKKSQLVANRTGSREGRVRALKKAIQQAEADVVLNVNIVDTHEAVARIREAENPGLKLVMALHGLNAAFYDDIAQYSSVLDGVIATNRLAVEAAVELSGFPKDRAFYASGGVVVSELAGPEISGDSIDLLYSGRFDAMEKRVMDLPGILGALDRKNVPYRLYLAGAGPDESLLRSALEPWDEKVEFLGVLDAENLASRFYKRGRILLILSPSETGPIVAWEAMSKGAIVVTTRFIGIGREGSLVDGETCLSFPVGDIDAAANAIADLQDEVFRNKLAIAGHELVTRRYSRPASIQAWHEALRQIQAQPAITEKWIPGQSAVSGRLDRFLGTGLAETLRELLGIRFVHDAPGNEWPHSYGKDDNESFRLRISALDTIRT